MNFKTEHIRWINVARSRPISSYKQQVLFLVLLWRTAISCIRAFHTKDEKWYTGVCVDKNYRLTCLLYFFAFISARLTYRKRSRWCCIMCNVVPFVSSRISIFLLRTIIFIYFIRKCWNLRYDGRNSYKWRSGKFNEKCS